MLTELGSGVGGSITSESPLSTLGGDYSSCIDSSVEFEYIESQLSDPYCGGTLQPPSPPPSPPRGAQSSCLPSLLYPPTASSNTIQPPFLDCASHYENDLVSLDRVTCPYDEEMKYDADLNKYDHQDLCSYDPELASYNQQGVYKTEPQEIGNFESDLTKYDSQDFGKYDGEFKYEDMLTETTSSCSPDLILPGTPQLAGSSDFSAGEYSPQDPVEGGIGEDTSSPLLEETYVIGKGKVNDLQRTALDAIFNVTDRPSRNMVLHIASELRLHHVTVKNFFSNARRRVRRAAARLSDPERSRRENRRRKEKRKMAALAAAAAATAAEGGTGANGFQFPPLASENSGLAGGLGCGAGGLGSTGQKGASSQSGGADTQREPTAVSPQRRALMEKLADKVQRSAAQRNLAALPEMTGEINYSSMASDVSNVSSFVNSSINSMTTAGGNVCSTLTSDTVMTDFSGNAANSLTVNLGSPMTINMPSTMSGTITSNLPGYAPNSSMVNQFSANPFASGNNGAISCSISDPSLTCSMADIIDTALSNSSISSLPNTASSLPVSPSLSPSSSSSCGGGETVPPSDLLATPCSWPQSFLGENSMEYQQEPWELPNLY